MAELCAEKESILNAIKRNASEHSKFESLEKKLLETDGTAKKLDLFQRKRKRPGIISYQQERKKKRHSKM